MQNNGAARVSRTREGMKRRTGALQGSQARQRVNVSPKHKSQVAFHWQTRLFERHKGRPVAFAQKAHEHVLPMLEDPDSIHKVETVVRVHIVRPLHRVRLGRTMRRRQMGWHRSERLVRAGFEAVQVFARRIRHLQGACLSHKGKLAMIAGDQAHFCADFAHELVQPAQIQGALLQMRHLVIPALVHEESAEEPNSLTGLSELSELAIGVEDCQMDQADPCAQTERCTSLVHSFVVLPRHPVDRGGRFTLEAARICSSESLFVRHVVAGAEWANNSAKHAAARPPRYSGGELVRGLSEQSL